MYLDNSNPVPRLVMIYHELRFWRPNTLTPLAEILESKVTTQERKKIWCSNLTFLGMLRFRTAHILRRKKYAKDGVVI